MRITIIYFIFSQINLLISHIINKFANEFINKLVKPQIKNHGTNRIIDYERTPEN